MNAKEVVVGRCGNCGGAIVAGHVERFMSTSVVMSDAACRDCGAEPVALVMREWRRSERAAKPED